MTSSSSVVNRERLHHLASTLDGSVVVPESVAYNEARQVWNRAVDRRPAAVLRCASVDDVRRGLEFSMAYQIEIAVRSGGHSQAGHGVADGALVLDLRGLNRVTVNPSSLSSRVQGGTIVSELMMALRPYGLLTPTGGCPDVGLGGLTLGGGENMLMARYGAVCDNVLAADVVLTDGRLVVANPREHPDLFWALRGGGGNFGIVTSFEYQLVRLEYVLSGLLYFPVSQTADVLRVYRDLIVEAPDELQTAGGLMGTPHGAELMVSICYCGNLREGERIVDRWRKLLRPTKDTVQAGPYTSEFSMGDGPSAGGGAFLPALSDAVIDVLAWSYPSAPPYASAVWNDFHGAVTRVPIEATAFPLRRRGFDLFICAPWQDEKGRRQALTWLRDLQHSLQPHANGVYVNNLEDEEEVRVREAYGPNYARLSRVKAKYDPRNVFRVNQNITPAGR
jgi:FAD/FMN-containing dehydrogenase